MPKKTKARGSTVARALKAATAAPSNAMATRAAQNPHNLVSASPRRNRDLPSNKASGLPLTVQQAAARRYSPADN